MSKLSKALKKALPVVVGIAAGALTGGAGGLAFGAKAGLSALAGGALGGMMGINQAYSYNMQDKQMRSQLQAAEAQAMAQNSAVVATAPVNEAAAQNAQLSAIDYAAAARRRYTQARTVNSGGLGGNGALGRRTLG